MNTAAMVRQSKEKHPEQFCAVPRCLWRIKSGDRYLGPCGKHPVATTVEVLEPFTFADGGVRLAFVTWSIGDGERRAVSVREAVTK